jgi:hypothetical protein
MYLGLFTGSSGFITSSILYISDFASQTESHPIAIQGVSSEFMNFVDSSLKSS